MDLAQLLTAVMFVERELDVLTLQTFTAREKLVNGKQERASGISLDGAGEGMDDGVVVRQFAALGKKRRVAGRHDGRALRPCDGRRPEASPQRIVVHRRGSYAGNSHTRVGHVGVAAMDARTPSAILVGEHG